MRVHDWRCVLWEVPRDLSPEIVDFVHTRFGSRLNLINSMNSHFEDGLDIVLISEPSAQGLMQIVTRIPERIRLIAVSTKGRQKPSSDLNIAWVVISHASVGGGSLWPNLVWVLADSPVAASHMSLGRWPRSSSTRNVLDPATLHLDSLISRLKICCQQIMRQLFTLWCTLHI